MTLPASGKRQSIRMKGYDYTVPGAYFVTLVTWQRKCVLGEIQEGSLKLSDMGKVAQEEWVCIPARFPAVELGEWVIMPSPPITQLRAQL